MHTGIAFVNVFLKHILKKKFHQLQMSLYRRFLDLTYALLKIHFTLLYCNKLEVKQLKRHFKDVCSEIRLVIVAMPNFQLQDVNIYIKITEEDGRHSTILNSGGSCQLKSKRKH